MHTLFVFFYTQETWKAARDQAKTGAVEEGEDLEEDEVDGNVEDEDDDRTSGGVASTGGEESGQGFKRPHKEENVKNKSKNKQM